MWGCLIHLPPQTGTMQQPAAVFRKHKLEKKRAYQQQVQDVEQSSFTPLVLSATGGMGAEATTFYKHLTAMLSQKWETPYSKMLCWLRCRLSYSLIHSAIQAIRGTMQILPMACCKVATLNWPHYNRGTHSLTRTRTLNIFIITVIYLYIIFTTKCKYHTLLFIDLLYGFHSVLIKLLV